VQAIDYAKLAQRAYNDAPTVGEPDSASRMHVYQMVTATGTQTVHVFRGTDDLRSLLADGDIIVRDVPGMGNVHAGFHLALAAILPACLALPRPDAIAGHSLGAAMALLYAGALALLGDVVPVYAFEPPRLCADSTLADLFHGKHVPVYATRNGRDIVTQVPPQLAHACPITPIGHAVLPFDNIQDHAIDRVIAALGD